MPDTIATKAAGLAEESVTTSDAEEDGSLLSSVGELSLAHNLASQQRSDEKSLTSKTALTKTKKQREKDDVRHGEPEEEMLVDLTEMLPLHSKRLDRRQKRREQKNEKVKAKQALSSIFRLPAELLLQVLSYLEPLDLLRARLINQSMLDFVQIHESVLAKSIIQQRYWVLSRSFPQPVLLSQVDPAAHPALLNTKRQNMLAIHKKPYQHVPVIDMLEFCTCMSCVFAWNNLCIVLDSAHWQNNLDRREPIPMISRGSTPQWNEELIHTHATVVRRSIKEPLTYAAILQRHLHTINRTLARRSKWLKKPGDVKARLYDTTDEDLASGTDEYLERYGPHSYEFPYHRDNYYSMEAYVPNRKWSKEAKKWLYYSGNQHERDVAWTVTHFSLSS